MILSYTQNRAFNKLFDSRKWLSAYELQESRGTLDALVRKGLLITRHGLGCIFDPRVGIKYKVKGV